MLTAAVAASVVRSTLAASASSPNGEMTLSASSVAMIVPIGATSATTALYAGLSRLNLAAARVTRRP